MANGSRTLATGAAPTSRAARLGEALGTGLASGGLQGFQRERQLDQAAQQFEPIRQALQESFTGPAATPGQRILQGVTQDPRRFAQFMQDPQAIESTAGVAQMAQPTEQEPRFPELAEINATLDRLKVAEQQGEGRRASLLRSRLKDMTGMETINTDLDLVQRVGRDGSTQTLWTDRESGDFFDLTMSSVELSPQDQIIESTTATGAGTEALPESQQIDIQDKQTATQDLIGTSRDALQLLEENPDAATWTGGAARFINDIQQEGIALARNIGLDFDPEIVNPSRYSNAFDQLGIENSRWRGLVTSLAFKAAAASGQTGRSVSDRDVQRFIREIGAQNADPRAIAANLRDVAQRTVRDFENTYRNATGQDFEGDLGIDTLPTIAGTQEPVDAPAEGGGQQTQQGGGQQAQQGEPERPPGVPGNAQFIGRTENGFPVWEDNEGQQYVWEPE